MKIWELNFLQFFRKTGFQAEIFDFWMIFVLSKDGNHFAVNFLFFFQHESRDTTLEIITLKAIRSTKENFFLGLLYTWGTVKSNNLSTCKDGEFPEFYTFRSIGHTNFPIWRRKFDGTFPYILIQRKSIFSWIWACWPFHCFDLCSSKWVRGQHPWHGLESTNLLTKF